MKLKYLFFTFLLLAVVAFWMMRSHQFTFEAETGLKFNVMEFELPGSPEKLNELIEAWSEPKQKEFVLKQLRLDYFFMFTLFPAIFILCLWAKKRFQIVKGSDQSTNRYKFSKSLLVILASLQVLALAFDVSENLRLTGWILQGFAGNMLLFETLVKLKFLFAILGFLGGLLMIIFANVKLRKSSKKRAIT